MKLRKRLGAWTVGAAMLLTMAPALTLGHAAAAGTGSIVLTINNPSMTVNGTAKNIDANGSKPALDKGGYTMLPLRGVVEAMGGNLTWDAKTRTITMTKDNQNVQLTVGSTKAVVDGTTKDMLANGSTYKAPYLSSAGRTLVHVRALELFTGTTCTWDQTKQQVTVAYADNSVPQVTSKNYRVDIVNKTSNDVTNLRYTPGGTYQYSQTNALSGTLAKNGTASFYISVPDTGTSRMYDFYTEGPGGMRMYSGLNFNGVNAYVSVVLKDGQKFVQANDKAVSVAETELTFKNNSDRDVEELYMSKSNSFSDADNLLASETVKSGKSTTVKIDLDGTKTWYFQAVNEKGKEFSGKVTFESETAKTASLTLTKGEKISLGNANGDGDLTVALINNTDQKIYQAYLVEKGEGKDFDIDDYDEDQDLLDGSKLSSYSQVALEDAADAEEYDIVLFYDSGDKDHDYFSVDFEKADSYAAIYVDKFSSKRFSGTHYTDYDDKMIVGIYNDTDEDLSSVGVSEYRSSKSIKSIGNMKDGEIVYMELNTDDYPDININWSGNSKGIDIEDLDDEDAFVLITLRDDDDADVENIDDL